MGLFLGFLSCSIDLFLFILFLCQYHTVWMTVALQYSLKSGSLIPPTPFYSSRLLWLFGAKTLTSAEEVGTAKSVTVRRPSFRCESVFLNQSKEQPILLLIII